MANRLSRVTRLVLRFDPAERRVRGRAEQFLRRDRQRARHRPPSLDLSYAYTFDSRELKQPVIEAIHDAGWEYRPVVTFVRAIGG